MTWNRNVVGGDATTPIGTGQIPPGTLLFRFSQAMQECILVRNTVNQSIGRLLSTMSLLSTTIDHLFLHIKTSSFDMSELRNELQQMLQQATSAPREDLDGALPTPGTTQSRYWIWNEGTPADISLFEGSRIILLGPPPYTRTWSAGRSFPSIAGQLDVLDLLTPAQIEDWLTRLAAAPK
jgi:hypothetical protein